MGLPFHDVDVEQLSAELIALMGTIKRREVRHFTAGGSRVYFSLTESAELQVGMRRTVWGILCSLVVAHS